MVNPFFLLVKYRGLLKGFIVFPRRLPPTETGAAVGEKVLFPLSKQTAYPQPGKKQKGF